MRFANFLICRRCYYPNKILLHQTKITANLRSIILFDKAVNTANKFLYFCTNVKICAGFATQIVK